MRFLVTVPWPLGFALHALLLVLLPGLPLFAQQGAADQQEQEEEKQEEQPSPGLRFRMRRTASFARNVPKSPD